jgi:2-polyprenyl-3-methyl-5-hydroxy-6-metoxy-1,4-benzoquinol methylase
MIIKNFLDKINKKPFIFNIENKITLKQIFTAINKNKLGFIILKKNNKYQIVTDGDLRRFICKKKTTLNENIRQQKIGTAEIISIDYKMSLYKAARFFLEKKINTLIVTKENKIYSYILKDEIIEYLSPERLNVEKDKLKKYQLDLNKHFLRYNFASLFTSKKFNVLDAACGTGYGSFILAKKSRKVTSIDYSKTAIKIAKQYYSKNNITFLRKNINNFASKKKFDLIVSIETLEHLSKYDAINWLKKCKKMLKKSGLLICSSPLLRIKKNKPYITNPHHLYEMKKREFFLLLKKIFKPKVISAYIQHNSSYVPITNEENGLCFAIVKI